MQRTEKSKILLIYTGGTIGMSRNFETGALEPFNFNNIAQHIPELKQIPVKITIFEFEQIIDSSEMNVEYWQKIADKIFAEYQDYDGFVVLHGTDTMAYTGSALSFMLQNLTKPIILTGSQLPVGDLRTDAKENLISSIYFASLKNELGESQIQEVAIYFEYKLYRANRATKINANHFDAFDSPNFPPLGESGITMEVNEHLLLKKKPSQELKYYRDMSSQVMLIKIFPGMQEEILLHLLESSKIQCLLVEAYGSGNIFNYPKFFKALEKKINKGMYIIILSQCVGGSVSLGKYGSSKKWQQIGAISGKNMTTEAALVKSMHLLAKAENHTNFKLDFTKNLFGECFE